VTTKKPDLSSIKKRLADQQADPAPIPKRGQDDGPRIREETHKQVAQFSKEMHRLAEEESRKAQAEPASKVDLGPLPEGVAAQQEDTVFYRNTSFDNPKVRAAIEGKCREMDFGDLILSGRVLQDVPIISGKLEATFQSLLGSETFWIEKHASEYGSTDWAVRSWLGYARLAISLRELNGTSLPDHRDKDGNIDKAYFDEKYSRVMALGEKVIELLFVNLGWFNDRVERLYQNDFELLKNG